MFGGAGECCGKDYTAVLKRQPDDTIMLYHRGSMYYDEGDYRLAIADWEALLRIDPDAADVKQKLKDARAQMRKR